MDALRRQIEERKKNSIPSLSVEEQRLKTQAEKARQLNEQKQRQLDEEDKILKKLKIQNEYYQQYKVEDVKVKRLDEIAEESNAPQGTLLYSEQLNTDAPPVERKEVQRRLRDFNQPITYFGETDWQRYKRLLQFEQKAKDGELDPEGNYLSQKNNEKLNLRIQEGEDIEEVRAFIMKLKERNLDPNSALVPVFKQKTVRETELMLLDGVSVLTRCEDVFLWSKKMIREWHIRLQEMYPTETSKRSLDGSQAFYTYKQTQDYIKPLTDQLQKVNLSASSGINEEILNAIYLIVRYCVYKEYVMAHDKYLELAIGNAPWPMGVTMVGIHERTGRSKIFSSQIAHILNDETQRKFIQAIKRLITISQKLYPSLDPSKMVDFRQEYAWVT